MSCRREGDEVYLPFSFLHDYFEVFGTLSSTVKGTNRFEWSHTNAKVNYPKETYDPKGIFMYFENYNVEVKMIQCFGLWIAKNEPNIISDARSCEMY